MIGLAAKCELVATVTLICGQAERQKQPCLVVSQAHDKFVRLVDLRRGGWCIQKSVQVTISRQLDLQIIRGQV